MQPQHGSWPRPDQPWLFKYGKTPPLGTHKRWHMPFSHWTMAPLHACFPSCQSHRGILLIIHWPPFADHTSPYKMLEWPVTSSSSMQNWEHLDFKTSEVERRENEKPCTVYRQQSCLWDVVRITLPTHSLCRVKSCHLRSSLSVPTTQKLPLQAARQELVLKLQQQAWHTHLETTATFPRDNRWVPSTEKVILLTVLLLRHRKVRPYFCAAVSLKSTKNILVNSITIPRSIAWHI